MEGRKKDKEERYREIKKKHERRSSVQANRAGKEEHNQDQESKQEEEGLRQNERKADKHTGREIGTAKSNRVRKDMAIKEEEEHKEVQTQIKDENKINEDNEQTSQKYLALPI